jgi:tRNA threonylcarbamoyl adenosine modification protein (Sua5/YciO/YrdC/YwlC family)
MRDFYAKFQYAEPVLLSVNSEHPEPRKVERAVEVLRRGGLLAYPTDTVYGLGCDLMNKKAIERLYEVKRLDKAHQLAFICPDLSEIARYAVVENHQYRVLRRFLPGPYCFILEATREVPKLVQTKRKTIGIRIPNHEVIRAVARGLGGPIISTTAQRKGEPEPEVDPSEIDSYFPGLELILDGGGGGLIPTTVIDLTVSPPQVIREGAGSIEEF